MLLTALAQAQDRCDRPTAIAELDEAVAGAIVAYERMERAPFDVGVARTRVVLGCLGDPVDPQHAAAIHRLLGLQAWLDKRADRTALAFAAARTADPTWHFPSWMAADAGERAAYERAPSAAAPTGEPPPAAAGTWRFDGVAGGRQEGRPVVVQLSSPAGRVLGTAYLWSEEPIPAWYTSPPPEKPRPRVAPWVALAASVAVAGAGAYSYGSSWYIENNYEVDTDYYAQEVQPRAVVGVSLLVAGGLGAAGSGLWLALGAR